MRATRTHERSVAGDQVTMEFGGREVLGRIVEDLGPIGVRGRRILRVEAYLPPDALVMLDVPAEELPAQKCQGHLNGFHHLDPRIASLEKYDLGIKLMDDHSPPPSGSPSEPRLYLFVSVRALESPHDYGTITYARSRTFLHDGFPSSEVDRRRLTGAVIGRLARDVDELVGGGPQTSEEQPIFLNAATITDTVPW